MVGAASDDENGAVSGSAYVFDVAAGTQVIKITPLDATVGHAFGRSVAVWQDRALVGAHNISPGSAYLFDSTSGQQVFKLVSSDGQAGDAFGERVAFAERFALAGSMHDDDNGTSSGSAYVFDAATGAELHKIIASDAAAEDYFGYSLAASTTRAVVGAIGNDDNGSFSGSAYVFDLPPQPFAEYGSGCPGTGGIIPQLAMTGSATPGGQVQLDILNGVGSGTAFVFLGLQQAALNMGFGCTLNVAPLLPAVLGPVPLFPLGAQGPGAGSISIPATIPANVVAPATVTLQAFIADSGAPGGFSNSNGIEMNVE